MTRIYSFVGTFLNILKKILQHSLCHHFFRILAEILTRVQSYRQRK